MILGYAQTVITPSLDRPVFLAGFGHNRRATTVHDHLTARALCLRTENLTIVLVAADLIGLFGPDVAEVSARIQAVEPDCRILIASTHTHHGPDTLGLWGPNERATGVDPIYMAELKEKLVAVSLTALANATQPVAEVIAHGVRVLNVARNARNRHIVDKELVVARFCAGDGQTLATLCDFPCHPAVLGDDNTAISADYPDALRCAVETATGAPCLFFSGALGGMMIPNVVEHSFAAAEEMGARLAAAATADDQQPTDGNIIPYRGQPVVVYRPSVNLFSFQRRPVRIPRQNPRFAAAVAAGLLPDRRNQRGEVVSTVSLIKIGELWLAGVPGEMSPKVGLELKEAMLTRAKVAAIIGLADDELGHILHPREYTPPDDWLSQDAAQYEESLALGPEAYEQVITAIRVLL